MTAVEEPAEGSRTTFIPAKSEADDDRMTSNLLLRTERWPEAVPGSSRALEQTFPSKTRAEDMKFHLSEEVDGDMGGAQSGWSSAWLFTSHRVFCC